jgi:hypothetical protein
MPSATPMVSSVWEVLLYTSVPSARRERTKPPRVGTYSGQERPVSPVTGPAPGPLRLVPSCRPAECRGRRPLLAQRPAAEQDAERYAEALRAVLRTAASGAGW